MRVIVVNIRGDKYDAWMGACERGDTKQDKVMPLSGEGIALIFIQEGQHPHPHHPW